MTTKESLLSPWIRLGQPSLSQMMGIYILKQKIFNATCLLNEADSQRLCKKNSICEERDGCLYDTLYVPKSNILQMEIIQNHHDSLVAGHPGYEKTIDLLQCNYWWPRMATLVKDYVARCDTCQRFKGSN